MRRLRQSRAYVTRQARMSPTTSVTGGLGHRPSHALQASCSGPHVCIALDNAEPHACITFDNIKVSPPVAIVNGETRVRAARVIGEARVHITFVTGKARARVAFDTGKVRTCITFDNSELRPCVAADSNEANTHAAFGTDEVCTCVTFITGEDRDNYLKASWQWTAQSLQISRVDLAEESHGLTQRQIDILVILCNFLKKPSIQNPYPMLIEVMKLKLTMHSLLDGLDWLNDGLPTLRSTITQHFDHVL
ncbi:hypothetical protein GGX14DRAFT_408005 [Mycena pura]|uniref:Uncharacterized protein n=1 Tax=Mycena pura TaxID=153505 RepID=A0AAD6UM13_9AGAR|nr:hypothetical protein GGX14DRAFT_408005 [Mycena pura]